VLKLPLATSVVESALCGEDGAQAGQVVKMASWNDAERTCLAAHEPEPTDVLVELRSEKPIPFSEFGTDGSGPTMQVRFLDSILNSGARVFAAAMLTLSLVCFPASRERATAQPNSGAAQDQLRFERFQPPEGGSTIVKAGLFDWLFGGSQREERREQRPRFDDHPRHDGDEGPIEKRQELHERNLGTTYETVCVRLCDGYYFPISYATLRSRFTGDARRCEQTCPSRSRLFVFRNPGETVQNMVDLEGRPYRDLPTAFQHLTAYNASCTCQGNPWDEAALARHRAYAEEPKRNGAHQLAQQPPATTQPQRRPSRQSQWGYRDFQTRRHWGNDN